MFRIDAVPYIWKQLGTTCRNLPQVHTIVRMLRMVLECVCPAVILKGEVVMAPKELAAYFGTPEKPECHMLYNVSTMVNLWGALASRDTRLLKAQLDALHALPDNCWFVNYLRCHDDIGWGLDEAVENRLGIDPRNIKNICITSMRAISPQLGKGRAVQLRPRHRRRPKLRHHCQPVRRGAGTGKRRQNRTGLRRKA